MGPILLLDNSYFLRIGIFVENEWKESIEINSSKSSSVLHNILNEKLHKYGLKLKDLDHIFHLAGPGSYTGMRLSEGFAQVLEWQGKKCYSIYHFEVPQILKNDPGVWIAPAQKKEFFAYSWKNASSSIDFVDLASLESFIEDNIKQKISLFTHFRASLPLKDENHSIGETSLLIKQNFSKLDEYVRNNNLRRPPYYFRSLEKEFTKGKHPLLNLK